MRWDASALRSAIAALSTSGTRKFKIAKDLIDLSDKRPEKLYPHFDVFCDLLETPNNIIKWSAFRIVANLAAVDKGGRIDKIIGRYLAPIAGPVMITAANAIVGSARIARTHKHLTGRIVRAILQVQRATYQTDECRNVAIGHAIKALGTMEDPIKRSEGVVAFVERQTGNTRGATRKKAQGFLKRISKGEFPCNAK